MPNWILGTKRRRSKDDREPMDLKKPKEKALNKSVRSGTCSSSDSLCSMSPVGSSSSDQDPTEPTLGLDCKLRCGGPIHVSSTSEDSGEEPLDLSVKDHRRSGEGYSSRTSESPDRMLRRLEINAQINLSLYDANLRYQHHYLQQQKQQQLQQVLEDQQSFKGTSGESRSKVKTHTVRKRHLSTDGVGEDHVTEALVTPEAVARLERIENKIGGYDCKLCENRYSNAFELANHNCSGIVKVEHRCPECNKVFQCPANLASHRRWHGLRASNREPLWAPEKSPSASELLST